MEGHYRHLYIAERNGSSVAEKNTTDDRSPSHESEGNSSDPVFESLRRRGHRITAQRETILQIFREQAHGNHLSAEELHAKLPREVLMLAWPWPIARSSFSRR